jgi:hypothetical protein
MTAQLPPPVAVAPATTSVAVVGTSTPAPPIVKVGLDWVVLLPVVFAGLGVLLGQVLNYLKSRENGKKSDDIAAANVQQNAKLGRIEVLVDGRYGEVLQELADVKRLLAATSGLKVDQDKAAEAQTRADDQAARVAAVPPAVKEPPAA